MSRKLWPDFNAWLKAYRQQECLTVNDMRVKEHLYQAFLAGYDLHAINQDMVEKVKAYLSRKGI